MTAATEEMEQPFWLLPTPSVGLLQLVRRTATAVRPVVQIVREAAPLAAATVLLLQVCAGAAATVGLLATTEVLVGLMAEGGPTVGRALLVVVAAVGLRGAAIAAAQLAAAAIAPAVRRVAEDRLLEAALLVPLESFDDTEFHDGIHRATEQGLGHLERATDHTVDLLAAVMVMAAAAGGLLTLHPLLLPVLLLGVLPEGWAVLRSARIQYAGIHRTVTLERRIRQLRDLGIARDSAAELRACQAIPFLLAEHRQLAAALRDHEVAVASAQARTEAVGRTLAGLGTIATFATLGVLLKLGWMPLATVGTAAIAIRLSTTSLTQLVRTSNRLLELGLYVADYEQFLRDARGRARCAGGRPAPTAPCRIELHDVTFRYPGSRSSEPALRGVDLTLHAGHTIALIGENGSGKTTVAKLLAGLYTPTTGRITWDGVDLAKLDPATVADRVAMVPQHPIRWPHDARSNIRIGRHDRHDPDDQALHTAAHQAKADDVVNRLPKKWQTLLSREFRDGHELSGGQWQRLALARGLYRDGLLLICDEPTAPLDADAEHAVYETLTRLAHGRTIVLITHRLASVRHADRIYLLHEGQVVEQGTHDQLLAADGRYARLHALQARPTPATPAP